MKISALIFGFAGFAVAFAIAPALAEDLTAGKTAAQLFRSDCGACHRSPNGLVKERGNVIGVAAFLGEHYTTNPDSAAALAAYVSGLASPGSARSRSNRRRSADDMPATADVPRPPREVATASPRSEAPADALVARLRSILLDEGASAQAGGTGAPKPRKRKVGTDETAASPAAARTNAEARPAAHAEPKPRAGAPAETSPPSEPQ